MRFTTQLQYGTLLAASSSLALASVIGQHRFFPGSQSTGSQISGFQGGDFNHKSPAGSLRSWSTSAELCENSEGTAGYVDLDEGQRHIYFWSFDSRNDPVNDPVILWLTGGPGASGVSVGLFGELGPCLIKTVDGGTEFNPYSWNSNATILFIDQPIGVGFSYRDGPGKPVNLIDATTDMYEFLQVYYDAYPELSKRDFYIAGESFGGTWVPSLAARIQEQEALSADSGNRVSQPHSAHVSIPLKGIMLGNALVTQHAQRKGTYEIACTGDKPLFNESSCAIIAKKAPYCERLHNICAEVDYEKFLCEAIDEHCENDINAFFADLHKSPYNFEEDCEGGLCFPENDFITAYMNSTKVRSALRVPDKVNYSTVSYDVFNDFDSQGLLWRPSDHFVTYLLSQEIRVLIYVGNKDWYCNAPGMRFLVDGLEWQGLAAFRAQKYANYQLDGESIGTHKAWKELSYFEIDNAGHMVPKDKPVEMSHVLNQWIAGKI